MKVTNYIYPSSPESDEVDNDEEPEDVNVGIECNDEVIEAPTESNAYHDDERMNQEDRGEDFEEGESTAGESSDDEEDDDPDGMNISTHERAWALQIKAAVEAPSSGLRPVSDFEYAQYALVTLGRKTLEEALEMMRATQLFQSEYQVDNSVDQGDSYIQAFMNLSPGSLLHLDLSPETGEGMIALDLRKNWTLLMQRQGIDREKTWKTISLFWYYCLRASQPSLFTIREGIVWLFECHGFDWKNVDTASERRLYEELWGRYPWIPRTTRAYSTGPVANIFISLLKSFVSSDMMRSVQMGCQVEDDDDEEDAEDNAGFVIRDSPWPKKTLPDLYLKPTVEQAQEYVVRRAKGLMSLRNENERSFLL